MTVTTLSIGTIYSILLVIYLDTDSFSPIVTASTQAPDPMECLSILISSRARTRHRPLKNYIPTLTLQTRRLGLLTDRDGYMEQLRPMRFSVGVGDPLHPLDPRCVISPTHRRRENLF
jgi:hypothetical protein